LLQVKAKERSYQGCDQQNQQASLHPYVSMLAVAFGNCLGAQTINSGGGSQRR